MVLSIVSVCLGWEWAAGWVGLIFSIAAVVLGIIARKKATELKDVTTNPDRVFVKVANICGLVGMILGIIAIVLSVVCGIVECSASALNSLY